jgi:hypothetical protein
MKVARSFVPSFLPFRATAASVARETTAMWAYVATTEEFDAVIRRDHAKYAKVVRELAIKLD